MPLPVVTIGVPVYQGEAFIARALHGIQLQTYPELEVLISIDGPDEASREACTPFLSDPRFRLHIQPERLGWASNIEWLIRNRKGSSFFFHQQDDEISCDYIQALVDAQVQFPKASICYSKMCVTGSTNLMVRHRPILGDPLSRALTHLERLDTSMFLGLISGAALAKTNGYVPANMRVLPKNIHL